MYLQARNAGEAWHDDLALLLAAWASTGGLDGRGWSHREVSWFTHTWCLCRVGLSYDS